GHQLKPGKLRADGGKQCVAGRLAPAAVACGLRAGGNLPVRLERAEVVDAQHIEAVGLQAQAQGPEAEAITLLRLPVIQRIAPELATRGEVVRRHAGHRLRLTVEVEPELVAEGPGRD